MRDNPSVQHSHAPKHLETNDDPGEQHSHDPEQQDQVAQSYCEDPGDQFSDAPEHLETNDSKTNLEALKIKENPTATPIKTVIAKTFVPITCRGNNTNSDSCFFYPVCKSLKCGGKRVNCNYQKKWSQIVSEETTSVTSSDRPTLCPYFPLCKSSDCGGQGSMGTICNNYLKWKRVIENEDDFLLVDKVDAKKTQKAARAAAKRAQKRQQKITEQSKKD